MRQSSRVESIGTSSGNRKLISDLILGPITLMGMVVGFLASGFIISKKKPSPSKLLMWNVIVGAFYMVGQITYLFLTCPDGEHGLVIENGKLNLSAPCNADCHCTGISYSPVCDVRTGDTYFSPCHAGCMAYSKSQRVS